MANKQMTRSEVSCEYKWDLTPIFKNDEEFYDFFKEVEKEVEKISDYKGKIVSSAKDLLEHLKFDSTLTRNINKLYYYAQLNYDVDTTNDNYKKMTGKVSNLLARVDELEAYIGPEFLSVDYELIEGFYKDEPELKEFEFNLKNIYRYKKHTLSEIEEELMSKLSLINDVAPNTYAALTNTDLTFGTIKDELDNEVELTESNYSKYRRTKDRRVRKDAFLKLLNTYASFKNTIASTYAGEVEISTAYAKIKNYNSSLEASLYADSVSVDVYNNLIDTVNKNLDINHKYFDMKKEILKLDELHLYDISVDLVEGYNKEYPFEEAKELVLESLSILGEDYVEILKKAFDEKWIDIYNSKGKRGGAYSSGCYDTNPYILLNYENQFDDVSTLAHELGHSLHTYYSKKQPLQYSSYKIFVAEVASTVNELLLSFYILNNSNDKLEKKFILNNLMELFRNTIYRQVMFAEFERDMHALKEKKEILTPDLLSSKFYELNKTYFGNNVFVDEEIKYEWLRMPHLYYNFYVYKYAVGLSCASYIVENILNKKENAIENYKQFLSAGGSDTPINILKNAGIDVTNQNYVESALKMYDSLIEQFKQLN